MVACLAFGLSACASATPTSSAPSASAGPTGSPELAAAIEALPPSISSSGDLRIATLVDSPPSAYQSTDGNLIGWEIELGQLLAQRLGLEAKFVPMEFARILPDVASGAVDIGLSSIFDTPSRRLKVDFIDYYRTGVTWAALTGKEVNPEDACGLTVAVQQGTFEEVTDLPQKSVVCVAAGKKPIAIMALPTQAEVVDAVLLGKADALLGDSPVTVYGVQHSNEQLAVVGQTYDMTLCGIPVSKANPELAKALELALIDLQNDGTYERVLGKWGVDVGAIPKPA